LSAGEKGRGGKHFLGVVGDETWTRRLNGGEGGTKKEEGEK